MKINFLFYVVFVYSAKQNNLISNAICYHSCPYSNAALHFYVFAKRIYFSYEDLINAQFCRAL